VQADVIDLPFEDSTFDRVIISFGLRNVSELDKAVKEMYRVLKNGGIMVNIDFGKPSSILARAIFELYFSYFVPLLGKIFHKHVEYSYLIHSIHRFPAPIELIQIFKKAGFVKSTNKELFMGFVSVQTSIK
jgi:demethylmenaquinone methyltransferase/2-methoxy-6-polyprenyl-1,4-benzoquinol methylase